MANAFLPGSPFNTSADSVGAAYRNGDWSKASRGDRYSMARIGAGFLPMFSGALGNGLINMAENRAINKYENSPDFMGPPRNYNSGAQDPYTYSYANPASVGPPAPGQTQNGAQARSQPMPTFSNQVNMNDPVSMSLLMGSLGFTGTTGGYGPDQGRLFHPYVK